MESNEQNKLTNKNRSRLIGWENRPRTDREEEVRGMGERSEGLSGTGPRLWNSHGDVKYNLGNTVNNVIAMYGVR